MRDHHKNWEATREKRIGTWRDFTQKKSKKQKVHAASEPCICCLLPLHADGRRSLLALPHARRRHDACTFLSTIP